MVHLEASARFELLDCRLSLHPMGLFLVGLSHIRGSSTPDCHRRVGQIHRSELGSRGKSSKSDAAIGSYLSPGEGG